MGTLSYTPTKSKYSDVRKVEYCQYVESLLLKKKKSLCKNLSAFRIPSFVNSCFCNETE